MQGMEILEKSESREQCTESGWYAYDYKLELDISREHILNLKQLGGNFIYLSQLAIPFYKLEDKYMMIKGLEGSDTVRVAFYREFENQICEKIEKFFNDL